MPKKLCKAIVPQTGKRCKGWAVSGSDYCYGHGGRRHYSNERIRLMYNEGGLNPEEIVKVTGLSVTHVKQIVDADEQVNKP